MKNILNISLTLAIVFSLASFSQAQTRTPKANKRQCNQRARIHNGVQSGEVTKRERQVVNAQQANIKSTKREAKADGVVTRQERVEIQRKQNRASNTIKRVNNNDRSRN